MAVQVVILAAGQGKRMHSHYPKVLHRLAGKSLLEHVIAAATPVAPERPPIIIYGHQGHLITKALQQHAVKWVEQSKQLGTAHALQQALPDIADTDDVLILYGDAPLISQHTLSQLIHSTPKEAVGMVTAHITQPTGFGRMLRDQQGRILRIIEEKDATEAQRAIQEVNAGIYFLPASYLKTWLPSLHCENAQGEYYLTDIIALAVHDNKQVHSISPASTYEILGVNDRMQLAEIERIYQRQYAEKLMKQGVMLYDPARIDIRGELSVGRDVSIDINVILEGHVTIGDECTIGPHCCLRNVTLGDRVTIHAHTVLEGADIASDCVIGPFARIRPTTALAPQTHIGNFVEIKNSDVGTSSKINHLSYIGDSLIGQHVNIGAGTITCNYDGVSKHKTIIGNDVHIGSDTQLVAPVTIGEGATIGAGSTIAQDAPAHALTLTSQLAQRTVPHWQRPAKKHQQPFGEDK